MALRRPPLRAGGPAGTGRSPADAAALERAARSRPHLSVTVDDGLGRASRAQTVLVVDPFGESPELLERLSDVRHRGARIMTIHRGSADLLAFSHETLSVDSWRPARAFDVTQHVVTHASGATPAGGAA